MKSTNVIDMAAWRAAHVPEQWRGVNPISTPYGVPDVAEEIRMLLMSMTAKFEAEMDTSAGIPILEISRVMKSPGMEGGAA